MALNLGELLVQLGVDTSGFEKGLDKAQKAVVAVTDKLENTGKGLQLGVDVSGLEKGMTRAHTAVSTAATGMQKKLDGFAQTTSGLFVPVSALSEKLGNVAQVSGKTGAALGQIGEVAKTTAPATKQVADTLDEAGKTLNRAGNEAQKTGDSIRKMGGHAHGAKPQVEGLTATLTDMNTQMGLMMGGATLSAAFTAPFVLMGKAALDASVGFESAFAGVRKTVTATEEQFKQIENRFRSMAQTTPVAAEKLAHIGELAGQLGVRGVENLTEFTDVVAKLGVTTNLSIEEASTSLARFANIMQMPLKNVGQLGATIVELGNNLATTEQEITQFALRIAGAGKQVGLSEAQVVGFGAALSSVGIEAEAGGTAISRVFAKLATVTAKGGDDLKLFAQVAGTSSEVFAKAFKENAATATITFITGLKRLQDQGVNVFSVLEKLEMQDIRVRDALLRTAGAGDLLTRSLGLASDAWTKNTALNEEAGKRFQTTESRLQMLKNSFDELVRRFGDAVGPALNSLIDSLRTVVSILQDTPMPIQMAIAGFAGLLAVVGPLMLALAGLGAVISGIKAALPVLAVVFGSLTSSTGLAVMAIAALTIGIGAYAVAQRQAREETEKKNQSLLKLSGRYDELKATVDDTTKSEAERYKAAEDLLQVSNDIMRQFPNLTKRWDEHGNAVELDTQKLRENTRVAKENLRTKLEGEINSARDLIERLKGNLDDLRSKASKPSSALERFLGAGAFSYNETAVRSQIQETEKKITEAKKRLAAAIKSLYYSDAPTDSPTNDYLDPKVKRSTASSTASEFDDSTTEKTKYLDEFEKAFGRSQTDMLETFSRAQQDATTEFKRQQDQRMREFERTQQQETATLERDLDNRKAAFERSQEEEKTRFQRGQEDQLVIFKNRLEDEKDAFDKQLGDKRIAFDQAQSKERETFQRAQESKLTTFKNVLEDERNAYDRQLDDLHRAFERAQSAEKERYQRHQEDLLHAYRERQDKELEALRNKQDAEKVALNKAFDDRVASLKDKQKALREAAAQEEATNRLIEANQRLAKANEAINTAERSGDPREMAEAKLRLAEAMRNRQEAIADEVRRVENRKIDDQISGLEKERDLQEKALGEKQKTALDALKNQQENNLIAYKRALEDEKIAFEAKLNQAKMNYEREQNALKEALQRKQEARTETYKNELEDQKIAFETRLDQAKTNFTREQDVQREALQDQQAEALLSYQRRLDDEKTAFNRRQEESKGWFEGALADWKKAEADKQAEAKRGLQTIEDNELEAWKRIQEERATQYKRELEDLRDSFEKKLGAQRGFLADQKAMEQRMQGAAPSPRGGEAPAAVKVQPVASPVLPPTAPAPATPTPPAFPLPPLSAEQLIQRGTDNLSALDRAKALAKSGSIGEAAQLISDTFGLSLEQAKQNLLDNLPKFAKGAVVSSQTLGVFGDKGTEAVTPLSWLSDQIQRMGERMAAAFSIRQLALPGVGPVRMPAFDEHMGAGRRFNTESAGIGDSGRADPPEVRVFVGNREVYDLVVEAVEDSRRRGRS